MPPRKDDKAKDRDSTAVVSVNIDDFTRTRDSVIVSLATLQSAVSDLSRAYINHANTILNRGAASLDLPGTTASLLENGILGTAAAAAGGVGVGVGVPGAGAGTTTNQQLQQQPEAQKEDQSKKKRKRAHDPNAPKRALTPYFLFLQHNRASVAEEMGGNARPKDVSDECTRRWSKMTQSEKAVWKQLYAENLAVYQKKMAAYKAGEPVPGDDDLTEAAQQLQHGVQKAAAASGQEDREGAAEAEKEEEEEEKEKEEQSSESETSESEDEASPVPTRREPTPPRSNKRRRAAAPTPGSRHKTAPAQQPPSPSAAATTKKQPSSEKKGKAKGAGAAAAEEKDKTDKGKRSSAAAATTTAAVETPKTPKSDKKRKKRKSEAHAEE